METLPDKLFFSVAEVCRITGIKNQARLAKEITRIKLPGRSTLAVPRSEVERLIREATQDYTPKEKVNAGAVKDIKELETM